jgi:hypothetical protein
MVVEDENNLELSIAEIIAKLSTLRVDASGKDTKFNDIIQPEHLHHPLPLQALPAMALLVDKLRPRSLDTLTYHPELSNRLSSLVRALPEIYIYSNIPRPHPPTSPTSSSTAPLAPAKRPASSAPYAPSTAPASKRSKSTPASSKPPHHASSSSTLSPPCTISKSRLVM